MLKFLIASLVILCILIIIAYFYFQKETFTNEQGYYTRPDECTNLTLANCLNTSTCGYCMQDGFNSQCVPGTGSGPTNGQCKRWYHNDVFSRALISGDNDYQHYLNEPIFDQ